MKQKREGSSTRKIQCVRRGVVEGCATRRRALNSGTVPYFSGIIPRHNAFQESEASMPIRMLCALLVVGCLVGLRSCGSELVDSSELARLKAADVEVQKLRNENAQLTAQLASAKSVGRYQIHQN